MNAPAAVRVVVLNYNGRAILERCLGSVADAARRSRRPTRVTVLDNCSRDDSEAYVRSACPEVHWEPARSNRVFCSYNEYVAKLQEPYVVLLNNDIRVQEGYSDALVDALESDDKAWFAAPRVLNDASGEYEGGRAKMEMRYGLPWGTSLFKGHEGRTLEAGRTMQTGFGAYRRDRFLELGGYDDLFLPGTVEDTDLCFRGWKKGWGGVYCPDSVVYHMGQATFKREFGSAGIRRLNRRNLYLFVWKNVRDPLLMASHLVWMPVHLVRDLLLGRPEFVAALSDALGRLPQALERRRAADRTDVRSDREVFALSRSL
ncbi:MAG: hypothetical protein MOGMAGMI_00860 [Candidatus Omnitrophica bacterium]|nr:hypothetical protein [Candidatus Omnitrophota bacterium]